MVPAFCLLSDFKIRTMNDLIAFPIVWISLSQIAGLVNRERSFLISRPKRGFLEKTAGMG